ncbi:hypothetical protein FACS1894162_2370 [Bacteroidia bacterium]|nr:hypothetical protein FACS1894162_2370 [Bacteroidia bacterium]
MEYPELYELQREINRLLASGSKHLKGDYRIEHQWHKLQKMTDSHPKIRQLILDLEDLITETNPQDAITRLMDISLALYSLLREQSKAAFARIRSAKDKKIVPVCDAGQPKAIYAYRQIRPVQDALLQPVRGRLGTLKAALNDGLFEALCLYPCVDRALEDEDATIADFVENEIIPHIGKPMIAFLLQNFYYEDTSGNVRRFRALYHLKYETRWTLLHTILQQPYPLLQAAANEILENKKT